MFNSFFAEKFQPNNHVGQAYEVMDISQHLSTTDITFVPYAVLHYVSKVKNNRFLFSQNIIHRGRTFLLIAKDVCVCYWQQTESMVTTEI